MIALPIAALVLQNVGPAARIRIYAYLISPQSAALCLFAAGVGASLAFETYRFLVRRREPAGATAPYRWPRSTPIALVVLLAWVAWPHVDAFPANGSVQAREAWARSHVPEYATLAALPGQLPAVRDDIGSIQSVAPTGGESHGCAQSMNGVDMHFGLEVVGDRGRGVLRIDCTVDGGAIVGWQSATWHFAGRTVSVPRP